MGPDNKLSRLLAMFLARMHDPLQLRAFLCGSLLLVWYVGIYRPLSGDIAEASRVRAREEKHLALVRDIEALRGQVARFQGRLPEGTDPNEWIEYVLGGIRKYPLKLVKLDPATPLKHGPYNLMVLRIELEGAFPDLEKLIRWLESNERLFRVEMVRIEPHISGNGVLIMQLSVLGVMG
jgi:hypothetical protein